MSESNEANRANERQQVAEAAPEKSGEAPSTAGGSVVLQLVGSPWLDSFAATVNGERVLVSRAGDEIDASISAELIALAEQHGVTLKEASKQ